MTYATALELSRLCLTTASPPAKCAAVKFELSGALHYCLGADIDWRGPCAVFIHETGFGTSHAAIEHNNLFGISHERVNGIWQPNAYSHTEECLDAFKRLLKSPRYEDAWARRNEPGPFLRKLHKRGYNSDNAWLNGVLCALGMIKDINLI
jgi:hypothetical protein